ncbi:hypothetical protein JYT74_01465 [Crocinitomix catalasitica]|nr:hypothetical protein [Crocinitomix catalasitica]
MIRNYLLILIFSLSFSAYTQTDRKFFAGLNIGTKIANKNYASRYAGWYQNELPNTITTLNNYQQIYTILGDLDWQVPFDYFPQRIRYKPGLLTGLLLGFQLAPQLQASVEANFNKLKVKEVFSIQVLDPGITTSQEQYQLGEIYVEESRFNAKFNFDYINDGDKIDIILGISGMFGAWRIDEQLAIFRTQVMPIFSKFNPNNGITNTVAGLGWGAGFNLGLEYRFNDQIVAQLMYQPHHAQYDFGFDPLRIIRLQHDILVRILWK